MACEKEAKISNPFIILSEDIEVTSVMVRLHVDIQNRDQFSMVIDYGFVWTEVPNKPTLEDYRESYGSGMPEKSFDAEIVKGLY